MNILTNLYDLSNILWALNNREVQNFEARATSVLGAAPTGLHRVILAAEHGYLALTMPLFIVLGDKTRPVYLYDKHVPVPAQGVLVILVGADDEARADELIDMAASRKTECIVLRQNGKTINHGTLNQLGIPAKTDEAFSAAVQLMLSSVANGVLSHREDKVLNAVD